MITHVLGICVGIALLLYGAERAVDAAIALAHGLGVPTLLVGGTLVAVGSSVPEIATSMYAGLYGAGGFVVGHIIGSATSQITVGIGVVALLSPLSLERLKVGVYGVAMVGAMGLMVLAIRSGTVSRLEGGGLIAAYLLFVAVRVHSDDEETVADRIDDADHPPVRAIAWIIVGFALVAIGGHLLVVQSGALAAALGVPSYLLGLVTGLGTTAPEILIAGLAVRRGEGDIAVGTLFGSNVTDPLFSLGVGALVGGLTIDHVGPTVASATYMITAAALVTVVFVSTGGISRRAAVGCIVLYAPTFLL